MRSRLMVESLESRRLMAIVHVDAALGDDATGDGSAAAPYQTIGRGVLEAVANDEVQIAAGDYAEAVSVDKDITLTAVGLVTADSWQTLAANTVTWDGAFTSDANFTFNGPTLLRGASQFNGANVSFLGTVDSAPLVAPAPLSVNATTLARFGDSPADAFGAVAPLASITTAATGATNLEAGTFNTNGSTITFNNPVVLNADTIITEAGLGNVSFLSTVDSDGTPRTLTVNTDGGGDTLFAGAVGAASPLASLSTDADGATQLGAGTIITSGGGATFDDPVVLTADLSLTEQLAGNVTFSGTLDSDGTARSLLVTTTGGGTTRFEGLVGDTSPLLNLTTDAAGATQLAAASIETSGNQIYNDNVVLDANVTLSAVNATFNGNINSANIATPRGLTVNATGTTNFGNAPADAIGNTAPLALLSSGAGGTTRINVAIVNTNGSTVTFTDAVVLTTDVTINEAGTGDVSFLNTINSDGTARRLTVNTTGGGDTIFNGVIGNTSPLAAITTDVNGTTRIGAGAIQTNGATVTFNDPVILTANLTITEAGAGAVSFNNTVDSDGTPRALTVNTDGLGDTFFGDDVGAASPLASLTTDADGLTRFAGSVVITTGNQSYADNVRIEGDTTFTGLNISFLQALDSLAPGFVVAVNASALSRFVGAVGGTGVLGSLSTSPAGTTSIEGGAVTTVGGQTYGDPVTVTATTTFTSNGAGNILFDGTLDAAAANLDVTVNTAGITRFGGNVGGGATPIRNLTTNAGGQTNIAAGLIRTTLDQTYNDRVVLEAETITRSLNGNVFFASTVDAADNGNPGTSSFGITVDRPNGTTDVIFNAAVGGNTSGTDDPQGVRMARVVTNGPLRLIADITATELIDIVVNEGAAASATDDLTVQAGVDLISLANINLLAGDDITLATGSSVIAGAGTLVISGDFGDNDTFGTTISVLGASGPVGAGTQVQINGGGDDDIFDLQFARFRAGDNIQVNGGGFGSATFTLITEAVTFAAPCDAAIATSTSTVVPFGDSLTLFDTGQAANQVYNLNSTQLARLSGPTFQFAAIQQLDLRAGGGMDQLYAQMPGLPSVVQFDGGANPAGTSDQLDVIGSAGPDLITIGPVSAVSPHRPFEIANVEAVRAQGGDGNDVIVNNTPATALLEGQGGADILVGGPAADVIFGGPGVDQLYGLDGNDYLFPDHNFDGTPDGILTIADGDFSAGNGDTGFPGDHAVPLNNPGAAVLDSVCGIESLIDGGATKDVLTWLRAQILPVSLQAIRDVMNEALAVLDAANVNTAPPVQTVSQPTIVNDPDFDHWLDNLYQALLGRDFAQPERDYYVNAFASGATREGIVQGFLNSPERRSGILTALYSRYLGRALDAGGRDYWLAVWAQQGSEAVEAGIVGSGEFFNRVGGTNQAWVTEMYSQVMGRSGSPAEIQFWVDRLASTPRAVAAQQFVTSDEHRLLSIESWYHNYLSRSAEKGGANFWLGKLKSNVKPESVQASILASREFQQMVW